MTHEKVLTPNEIGISKARVNYTSQNFALGFEILL